MMLPFTRGQFFEVFAVYNAATWPVAVIAYPLALTALFLAWRQASGSGWFVTIVLAMMWCWVGVVYQGIYFREINPAAAVFAAAFVLQALLLLVHGLIRPALEFEARTRIRSTAGAAMLVYAMVVYPLVGLAIGESYLALPLFGVAPCPLVIFTFGLMLWASHVRWWLWLVPVLWSLIGGSAFIVLKVPQDWALPVSAAAALLIIWFEPVGRRTAA